jgi:hypothetical protein
MKNNDCKKLSFSECELAILRMAVDKADEKISRRNVNSSEIKEIISIVEEFLKAKKLICYGGTAINNILPKSQQFYNKDVEIPDYDFFSPNALNDAKELADIYYKKGYDDVEAKAGQHHGTYKVYVNYIPVADITHIDKDLFNSLIKESVKIDGILYAPANFLRMAMYLELSRPAGDISRWEKVLKRLILLNKNYPLKHDSCHDFNFQREMENKENEEVIFDTIKKTFMDQNVVFFGGYALSLYSSYMTRKLKGKLEKFADFDILARDAKKVAEITKERLKENGITNITIKKHEPVGEIIPVHFELKIGKDTVAFLYEPVGCHNYNVISEGGGKIRIATIDTILSFYLAFIYVNKPYYKNFRDKLLCMANLLFEVQKKNRLTQKGILKRFSIICYGHQESVEEIRAKKSEKHNELKNKRGSKEYEEWFLNYKPYSKKEGSEEKVEKEKRGKNRKNIKRERTRNKKTIQNKAKKNKTRKNKTLNQLLFGKRKSKTKNIY